MARIVRRLTLVAAVALGCGQESTGTAAQSSSDGVVSGGASGSPPAGCAAIATEYLAVLRAALVCDPAAPAPCAAERPLVVSEGSSTEDAKITGLCWVAAADYVNPARTAALDQVLLRYAAAGCTVGFCPGPSGGPPRCAERRGSATPTCG